MSLDLPSVRKLSRCTFDTPKRRFGIKTYNSKAELFKLKPKSKCKPIGDSVSTTTSPLSALSSVFQYTFPVSMSHSPFWGKDVIIPMNHQPSEMLSNSGKRSSLPLINTKRGSWIQPLQSSISIYTVAPTHMKIISDDPQLPLFRQLPTNTWIESEVIDTPLLSADAKINEHKCLGCDSTTNADVCIQCPGFRKTWFGDICLKTSCKRFNCKYGHSDQHVVCTYCRTLNHTKRQCANEAIHCEQCNEYGHWTPIHKIPGLSYVCGRLNKYKRVLASNGVYIWTLATNTSK